MFFRRSPLFAVSCALLLTCASQAHALDIIALPTLGGSTSDVADISSTNVVVGSAYLADETTYHAVRWDNGVITDLGTLAGGANSSAYGINAAGTIVGQSDVSAFQTRAFSWSGGLMTAAGTPDAMSANGINTAGAIAFSTATGDAYAINDLGVRVGTDLNGHPYINSNGTPVNLPMTGTDPIYPTSINSAGTIVGIEAALNADQSALALHAVAWQNNQVAFLPTLGGGDTVANDINSAGVIVGAAYRPGSFESEAVLWYNGQLVELNAVPEIAASGWTLNEVSAINDSYMIAGQGTFNGASTSFVLDLKTTSWAPVPEPSTYALMGLGLLAAGFRTRRAAR